MANGDQHWRKRNTKKTGFARRYTIERAGCIFSLKKMKRKREKEGTKENIEKTQKNENHENLIGETKVKY